MRAVKSLPMGTPCRTSLVGVWHGRCGLADGAPENAIVMAMEEPEALGNL